MKGWIAAAATSSLLVACGLGPQPEIPGGENSGTPETPPRSGEDHGATPGAMPPPTSPAADAASLGPTTAVTGSSSDAGGDAAIEASIPAKESEGDASAEPEQDDASDDGSDRDGGMRRRRYDAAPAERRDARGTELNVRDDGGDAAHRDGDTDDDDAGTAVERVPAPSGG